MIAHAKSQIRINWNRRRECKMKDSKKKKKKVDSAVSEAVISKCYGKEMLISKVMSLYVDIQFFYSTLKCLNNGKRKV